ncbi:MAG: hypothetical protein PHV98_00660 [Candidatus Omnitrophica bacterium]|nr:hypothetical protein [Candidatus Omnitrophota bacterium]
MSDDRGAVYIAIGNKALKEAEMSAMTLAKYDDLEVDIISAGAFTNLFKTNHQISRFVKTSLIDAIEFDQFVYLDADTRIRGSLMQGFDILDDGWDMAITASDNQDRDWCWHIGEDERNETMMEYGCQPIQLQAGVMFVKKCETTRKLFEFWREEWLKYKDQDQAALLRALKRAPVKLWILGKDYNGGRLVSHLFGKLRNK